MNQRIVRAAEAALSEAFEAVAAGDVPRSGAALVRLFELTGDAREPALMTLYGEGQVVSALSWLRAGEPAYALDSMQKAFDTCLAMGSADEVRPLSDAIMALRSRIGAIATYLEQPPARLVEFFDVLVRHVLDRVAPAGAQAPVQEGSETARLLARVADAGPSLPAPARLILARFVYDLGEAATDAQRTADALSIYVQSARLLESVAQDTPGSRLLAEVVYRRMAFERQRHGNADAMHRDLERFAAYMRKHGVDEAVFEPELAALHAYYDINFGLSHGDGERARQGADELRRVASPEFLESCAALMRAVEGDIGALGELVKPEHAAIAGPGRNMVEFAEICRLDELGWPELARLARMSFSDDPQLCWRAATTLGLYLDDHALHRVGILFSKVAARVLQHLRLELVQQRFTHVDPFQDGMARLASQVLGTQLVQARRLGEALRYAALAEIDQGNLPAPRVADIPRLVDANCPLSDPEREGIEGLRAVFAEAAFPDTQVAALFAQMDAALEVALPPSPHVDDDDPPTLPGVARLAVVEAGDDVRATLSGAFGVESATLSARPSDLDEIAFEALRALSSPEPKDAALPCRKLYDIVVAPFRATLDRLAICTLLVRAGGALRRIPFSVLHDGSTYLAERFAFVVHPGAAAARPRERLARPARAAILAVPDAPGLPALPAASADAALLQRLLAQTGAGVGDIVDGRTEPASRLEAAWARQPTIVQISSHFDVDHTDAGRSAFVLGDGSRYPLSRLAQQDLASVELALMMGCETQSVSDGGGALGITAIDALLLRMGVGSVVGTCWHVRDDLAHDFLKPFLEGVLVSGLDLAEAARRALVAQGRDPRSGEWRPPHEWGAFVLSGEWSGLRGFGGARVVSAA